MPKKQYSLTDKQKNKMHPCNSRAGSSAREFWRKKYLHCMNDCKNDCNELTMLKKIYWQLRKLNDLKK